MYSFMARYYPDFSPQPLSVFYPIRISVAKIHSNAHDSHFCTLRFPHEIHFIWQRGKRNASVPDISFPICIIPDDALKSHFTCQFTGQIVIVRREKLFNKRMSGMRFPHANFLHGYRWQTAREMRIHASSAQSCAVTETASFSSKFLRSAGVACPAQTAPCRRGGSCAAGGAVNAGIRGHTGAGKGLLRRPGKVHTAGPTLSCRLSGRSLQHGAARLMMPDQHSPVAKSLPTPFCRLVRQAFPLPPSPKAQTYSLPETRPPGRISARTSARRGCQPSLTV